MRLVAEVVAELSAVPYAFVPQAWRAAYQPQTAEFYTSSRGGCYDRTLGRAVGLPRKGGNFLRLTPAAGDRGEIAAALTRFDCCGSGSDDVVAHEVNAFLRTDEWRRGAQLDANKCSSPTW
jgi:hypothetical protein